MNSTDNKAAVTMDAVRAELGSKTGPQFWRSLEELSGSAALREALGREFPEGATEFTDPAGRRRFLQVMGASLALAGVTGCTRQPKEYIAPYAANPPEQTPGVPRYFATAMPMNGYGEPLLIESHENRPTKAEGNPEHPASQGATSIYAQTALLDMYDPDRLGKVIQRGRTSSWSALTTELRRQMALRRLQDGRGLRILTGTVGSPTLAAKLEQLTAELPDAKWHQWEPAGRDSARAASLAAFGEYVETRYDLSNAKVVLSLDSDFLSTNGPGSVRMVREFARGRKVADGDVSGMNRLYVVEPTPTTTGSNADHRLRLKAADVEAFAFALAAELGVATGAGSVEVPEKAREWLAPLAADLRSAGAAAAVIPGDCQSESVHRIAAAINSALGAFGSTVLHSDPVEAAPTDQMASLKELVADMGAGEVETLIVFGGNPVYATPGDVDFLAAYEKVPFRVYVGMNDDETGYNSHWQVPATHYLEAWGDIRAEDGTITIQQPLIEPLYQSKSDLEIVSMLLGDERSGHELIREAWVERLGGEKGFRKALHDGMVADTAAAPRAVTLSVDWAAGLSAPESSEGLELTIRPDASAFDGRFNNNGWLQELPRPISRITWENAALVSPATAEQLGVRNGEIVDLSAHDREVRGPVWILPGQADDAITVTLGYGRSRTGRVGTGSGFDCYPLQDSSARWSTAGLGLTKAGKRTQIACVQDHGSMEGRGLIQIANAQTYAEQPDFARAHGHHGGGTHGEEPGIGSPFVGNVAPAVPLEERGPGFAPGRTQGNPYADIENEKSFYPEWTYAGNAWGMTIDLNACVGCNACMAACQSENNIAVVGKEQVMVGRELHWIRIDRYFEGDQNDPSTVHQPVNCMQCENAPCEPVCPVGATVHSAEGLNDMVYNRCVGTRYCSNNCPYKVRRFNFLLYADFESETLKIGRNPDVTVRSRGVMEKCTYCTQRISAARISAEKEGREIADGEIRTACQQVCPAEAIEFGDINNPESAVAKLKKDSRNYGLLEELNTQPRTTYLARVRNVNPEMPQAPEAHAEEAHHG